ncbi:hypothetical protein PR048_016081 [Dryococelus australis]|uniref:Uncharacterized protein n=1 Tax=Dryococelus australis TaxID=614101 RepID=A0ABQ9HIS4_9NEOP|nr:hypothetical protein PR048_016081 [Dryococelus australis]
MLHTGSCGLHILRGAFIHGSFSSIWDVERILSSLYYLFKDSPARREDYVKATDSRIFPLKFCAVRWVENSTVAVRAVDMWSHVLKYVKSVTEKKFPNPNTKSFMAIKDAADDPLTPVELLVFQSIAKQIQPFLIAYRTDKLVLPFLGKDVLKMLRCLTERFIKDDAIKKANSCGKLIRIEVTKKENYLPETKVHLGFAAENRVKGLVHKNVIKQRDIVQLQME